MRKKTLVMWQCLFLLSPIFALADQSAIGLNTPVQVVSSFQKFEGYEMFCMSELGGGEEPIKVGKKFETYLTGVFYKLFLWSQCNEPENPPRYAHTVREFYWDIRSGIDEVGGMPQDYRVRPAKFIDSDRAIVKVLFDAGTAKHPIVMTITYTLIHEEDKWKIDDIAPMGDEGPDEAEPYLKSSASIKDDMQRNYNAALKRYQKEQAAKGATPKP